MIQQPTPLPKLIYFAERPRGTSRAAFRERWRRHARLGMSQPRWRNVERYVHCDSLEVARSSLPAHWCDGVAMVWYRSEECRLRHVTDRSSAPIMKRDEQETFARPVVEAALLSEELVLQRCQPSRFKLFLRLTAPAGCARGIFRARWSEQVGPRLLRELEASGHCLGYVQNHARDASTAHHVPPPLCDCVDELATNDMVATETAVSIALTKAGDAFGRVEATWTAETLLYSR